MSSNLSYGRGLHHEYALTEEFLSLQGEGARAGTVNVFVRFAGCNLKCDRRQHGFDCDTDFRVRRRRTLAELLERIEELWGNRPPPPSIILTGGEPALQVNGPLLTELHERNCYVAIETNGTLTIPAGIDWVSVSPKPGAPLKIQGHIDEVRYVRNIEQGLPEFPPKADHYFISPAWSASRGRTHVEERLERAVLDHCVRLVRDNPPWRLSVQQHKIWGVR